MSCVMEVLSHNREPIFANHSFGRHFPVTSVISEHTARKPGKYRFAGELVGCPVCLICVSLHMSFVNLMLQLGDSMSMVREKRSTSKSGFFF